MRTLGKLKLMAVSAVLVLGMSSCFKNDTKFAIAAAPAYALQDGSRYKMQIQVQGNEQIKSATATFGGRTFSFSAIEGTDNYYMQINSYSAGVDSIAEGICQVTASNVEGKSAVSQLQFSSSDKKIGVVTMKTFAYQASDGKITASWNKVENADAYYLLYKIKGSSTSYGDEMWLPYNKLTINDKENPSTTTNIKFDEDGYYEIAIGAAYKTTLRVSDRILSFKGDADASI